MQRPGGWHAASAWSECSRCSDWCNDSRARTCPGVGVIAWYEIRRPSRSAEPLVSGCESTQRFIIISEESTTWMAAFVLSVAKIAYATLSVIIVGDDMCIERESGVMADVCALCWLYYAPSFSGAGRRSREPRMWRLRTRLKLALACLVVW